jgi:hypothetical protein
MHTTFLFTESARALADMIKSQIADLKFLLETVLGSCTSYFLHGEQRVSYRESISRVYLYYCSTAL